MMTKDAQKKWYRIGVELGIDEEVLKKIEMENETDEVRIKELFKFCSRNRVPEFTYGSLSGIMKKIGFPAIQETLITKELVHKF